ncbi:MAG: hypothetical protein FWB76_00475 [Oscillospiraceae bacterium]|nr:hypothetical protein [Oscillospiraceae bacterium]
MIENEAKTPIILSAEMQKNILQFFMKTSILRKAKEERNKKVLLDERQEQD